MVETTHKAGDTVIIDSGARRVFATGAHRDRGAGKGAFNLIPYEAMLEIAQVFEAGGAKYTPNNWRLGMPLSEYANSAIRHSMKAGQGWDDENHAAQATWNWIAFMQTRHMIRQGVLPNELDDIENWLTNDGAKKAMENTRIENERRLAAMAAQTGAVNKP